MTDALFSLEDFGLRVEPTQAMREGTQVVDQCAYCGAVVVWHRGLYRAKLGQCPACDTQQGWWGQKLPVAGIHEHDHEWELVGSLEAGGAEEIASTDVDVDAATDRSGLSAAFDTGTD